MRQYQGPDDTGKGFAAVEDWGDSAADSDEEDDIREEEEPGDRYLRGFYAHICLGDLLDGRYRVIHKLGWGGFSTVWMATDETTGRDMALKIMRVCDVSENDYEIQTRIKENISGRDGLIVYERTFFYEGDMGQHHRVLVLPLVGPSLNYALEKRPMAARRSAARRLLECLAKVHAAGVVVNDLNSGGVMWGVKSLAHHDRKNKYRVLGRPQKTQAEWNNQVHRRPGDLVRTVKVPESLLEDSVYLGDFGMAFRAGGAGQKVVFPTFTAPERLHGIAPSAASDMWSYTVILAHLFFGKLTFTYAPTPMFNSTSAPPPLMTRLFDSFGPLPSEWKERYTEQGTVPGSYYGTPQGFSPHFHNTIENNLPQLSATDRSHLESVLSRGFQYHPEKRLTAAELLKDPSFIALTTAA